MATRAHPSAAHPIQVVVRRTGLTQDTLRARERAIALNRLSQLNNLVSLYKALGLGAESKSFGCRNI